MSNNVLVWITCRNYEHWLVKAARSAYFQRHVCMVAFTHDHCGKPNPVGTSAARNRVLDSELLPDFEWVVFLDADDLLPQNYLSELVAVSEGCDVVTCDMQKFGDETDLVRVEKPITMESLLQLNTIHCSALIRSTVFQKAGGYDESLTCYEDWELYLRLLSSGARFGYTDRTRLQARQHANSRHHTKTVSLTDMQQELAVRYDPFLQTRK